MTASANREDVVNFLAVHPGHKAARVAEKLGLAPRTVRYIVATDPRIGRDEEGALRLVAPPAATIGLVTDRRKLPVERRRHDCALLARCELAWIDAHGTAQGKCPAGCKWYRKAREVPIPSTLAAHV